MLIAGEVFAIVTLIVMLATGLWDFSTESIGFTIIMIIAVFALMPISFMSIFFINWKKALIGMIAPIPVLSYCIHCFKGLWKTFLALIALIRGKEEFTFNKYGVKINEDDNAE